MWPRYNRNLVVFCHLFGSFDIIKFCLDERLRQHDLIKHIRLVFIWGVVRSTMFTCSLMRKAHASIVNI